MSRTAPSVIPSPSVKTVKEDTRVRSKPFVAAPIPKVEPKKVEPKKPPPPQESVLEEVTDLEEVNIEELHPEPKNSNDEGDIPLIS